MSCQPSRRLATADDFAHLSVKQLVELKSDLQRKIEEEKKLKEDYQQKVELLAGMLKKAREPAQGIHEEIMQNQKKIEELIQQNLKNKIVVFMGLSEAIKELAERLKAVEDQREETRRQIKDVHNYLLKVEHYQELMQMNLLGKVMVFLFWLRDIFYSLIF